jgi:hypothetical protein
LLHATHAAFAKSISPAFLAPKLMQGAVEGRLPWVIGVALCASREVASIRHAWFVDLIRGGNFRWRREQGLESKAGFIKPCLDEDTCGLKHPQKAGETRK